MLHPSYDELIDIINEGNEEGLNPEINSRYSIVMAAARRARQIIDGEQPLVGKAPNNKPLTVAVEEIRKGKIKITEEGVDDYQFHLRNDNATSDLVYNDEEGDSVDPDEESEEDDELDDDLDDLNEDDSEDDDEE
ncbi:MAG: DNA-directed RNA polymerase subunit omega [Lachnospiraceae bacterium]|nr:DNA-directed RNA polymerase subunit omega [Lachnospiraceae bacterium]